jgi:hypothetical protein
VAPHALRRDEHLPQIVFHGVAVRVARVVARVAYTNLLLGCDAAEQQQPQELPFHFLCGRAAQRSRRWRNDQQLHLFVHFYGRNGMQSAKIAKC